jgi:hypothetical protein
MGQALNAATQTFHPPRLLPIRPTRLQVCLLALQTSYTSKMMESIPLDDPEDADVDWSFIAHTSDAYGQPEFVPPHSEDTNLSDAESDEEYAAHLRGELAPGKKKGGYDSRIEQILYENPQLPILITDAGKSSESGGKYIVYTIRTGVGYNARAYDLC